MIFLTAKVGHVHYKFFRKREAVRERLEEESSTIPFSTDTTADVAVLVDGRS